MKSIKIQRETGIFGDAGYVLYYNGRRTHLDVFLSITALRMYWKDFRREIVAGKSSELIFGVQ